MLVDAHVHVWDPAELDYPWLAGEDALNRPMLPARIDRGDETAPTAAMIFVQADCRPGQSLAEVRWVRSLAASWPELAAIVAAADLRAGPDLADHLDALAALDEAVPGDAARRRIPVPGVRHLLQDEPPERFVGPERDALLAGLRVLARRGLTFDLCVRHVQLGAVARILEEVPELPVVLDHLGKPPVSEGLGSAAGVAWAAGVSRIARLPRAHVKLSGLAAEAPNPAALDAHADEFLTHAIAAFGCGRSMIGSDWPVSAFTGAGGDLASWRERVAHAATAAGADTAGRADVMGGTAARFYGLEAAPTGP